MIMSSLMWCQRSPFEETCHFFRPSKKAQTPIMPLHRRFGEHMGEVRNVSDSEFNETVNGTEWVIVDFWLHGAPLQSHWTGVGSRGRRARTSRRQGGYGTKHRDGRSTRCAQHSCPFMYRNGTIVSQRTGSMPKAKLLAWMTKS